MVPADELPATATPASPSKNDRKRAGEDQDDDEDVLKSPTKKAKGKTAVKVEPDLQDE